MSDRESQRTGCFGCLTWPWWPVKFFFQAFAVLFALALIIGWIILLSLPSIARSTGADMLLLSLRVLDFESDRPVLPLYLLDPDQRVQKIATRLRGPKLDPVLPHDTDAAQRLVGSLYFLKHPEVREQVRQWGDGLIRLEAYRAREAANKGGDHWRDTEATLDEACLALAPLLRGIQPHAEADLPRLAEMVEKAFPEEKDRQNALAWADGLYDGMYGLFVDLRSALKEKNQDPKTPGRIKEVPVRVVLPPRTPATAHWILYQFIGLDDTSREVAARQWESLFPEERRGRIAELGRRIEQERRAAGEPLPPSCAALPWLCVLHRYQGYDRTGENNRDTVVDRLGSNNLSIIALVLLVANPSDDLFFPMTTSDPLRLLPGKENMGFAVIVLMILFAVYGFRLLLLPVVGEFILRLHHSRAYRTYRDGRAHGAFAVRLVCYVGIPMLAWGASLLYLPEELAPLAGDARSMLFAAFVAVCLGGMFVGVITRLTALVMLRFGIDVNRFWWDEIIGLALSLGLLAYFGNDWVNLIVFASAELIPMTLYPRPDDEGLFVSEPRTQRAFRRAE